MVDIVRLPALFSHEIMEKIVKSLLVRSVQERGVIDDKHAFRYRT
jgi:hypothetical protein